MTALDAIEVTEADDVEEPVTLDEVKAFMRVDSADDDETIVEMITSAREDIEQELNLALVPKDVVVDVNGSGVVMLPFTNKIGTVTIEDVNGATVTEGFTLRGNQLTLDDWGVHSVSYSINPKVPFAIKEAIKMLVSYRYNNRGDQNNQQGLPMDIKSKLSKYRIPWL